jgi:hypothetical protein
MTKWWISTKSPSIGQAVPNSASAASGAMLDRGNGWNREANLKLYAAQQPRHETFLVKIVDAGLGNSQNSAFVVGICLRIKPPNQESQEDALQSDKCSKRVL